MILPQMGSWGQWGHGVKSWKEVIQFRDWLWPFAAKVIVLKNYLGIILILHRDSRPMLGLVGTVQKSRQETQKYKPFVFLVILKNICPCGQNARKLPFHTFRKHLSWTICFVNFLDIISCTLWLLEFDFIQVWFLCRFGTIWGWCTFSVNWVLRNFHQVFG